MRLGIDIGCGDSRIQMDDTQFLRCDIRPEVKPDILCNVTLLPFADKSVDIAHSSHVLEHFPRKFWKLVLSEWIRVIKIGGEIWLRLPNIFWAAERMVNNQIIDDHVLNVLYGGQDNEFDFHYHGMTPDIIKIALEERGCSLIHFSTVNYNMTIGAVRN